MTELFYCPIFHISSEELLSLPLVDTLRAGVEKYTDQRARSESYGVRVLLQNALLQFGVAPDTVTLAFTEEGKPYLLGCPLYVSLAHSKGYLAVALGDEPLGVDVEDETAVRHPHQLAKRFLDEEGEWQVREAPNPHLAFLYAFTRLEATVKQKEGITLPLAKKHLNPIYYRTTLPLVEGKLAVLTAVGKPPFRAHKVDLLL